MPLDPRAKRFLDMLAAAPKADAARGLTVGERRNAFRKLMSLGDANVAIGRVEERTMPGPEGPIGVRIYTPVAGGSEILPGLVYFHGGGLVAGSLDTHDALCRTLANETGCRLLSVDYRLAPEHKFPAAVIDGCAAAAWSVEQAPELGIDPYRIAVGGDSAGASLAAIVCQTARQPGGVKLAAQLLICPIIDFSPHNTARWIGAETPLLDKATMDRDLEHYLPVGVAATDPRISPLYAAVLGGVPTAFVHTAEFDPLRDDGSAFANRLRRAGVDVTYTCHPGMVHLFYGLTSVIPYARVAIKLAGAEIRAALRSTNVE